MSDDLITIETPEHIHVQYELAGIGSRALAAIVDFLLQGLIVTLVVVGLTWLAASLNWRGGFGLTMAVVRC